MRWRPSVDEVGELLRFGAVGLANTVLGLVLIWGAMAAGLSPAPANLAGYAVGLVVSYVLNRRFTFAATTSLSASLPRWVGLALVGYMLNLGIVLFAIEMFTLNPYVSQVFGVVLYALFMFLGAKYFVFVPVSRIPG